MDRGIWWAKVRGILQARILKWVAVLSSGDLPNPGIEPRSHTLQVDALPAELPGKPNNTGASNLSPSLGDLPDPGVKRGLLHCRWILTS